MAENENIREMKGAELESMYKSQIHFKSPNNVKCPGLKLEEEDMKWWRDAKLGLFIHFGLYSLLGRGEWVKHNEKIPDEEYEKLLDKFNPTGFDAEEWVNIAKNAGMKYMVMVARHHDGFALWDSPGSYKNYTSMNSAAKKDLIKEYTEACRNAGLKVGIYYSPMDWRFPGYFKPKELLDNALLMKKQAHDQVEELVSKYGKIDIVWYDGSWLAHKGHDADGAWLWDPITLNQMVRRYAPKAVINPRSGWEGDFRTNEGNQEITGEIVPFAWEKNFTLGNAFGWTEDELCMPYEDVMGHILNTIMRDGNVLINVGPNPEGRFPESMVKVLGQIGEFMGKYGESIYGTRGGPFQPVDRVYGSTKKDNFIYIHILDAEAFEKLRLPSLEKKIISCVSLDGGAVDFKQDESGIRINVKPAQRRPVDTIVRLELGK